MARYLAGRILQAFGVVVFVTTFSFVLIHLAPGDPIATSLNGPGVTQGIREQWRATYGFDRPLTEQYLRWLGSAAQGELGYSFSQRRSVRSVFADAIPRSLLLSGVALLLSFALAIRIALLQAERAHGRRDRWLGRVLLFFYSVPDFWLALVMLLLFAYRFPLFPAGGIVDPVSYDYLSFSGKAADRVRHLILPVLTLTLLSTASIARYQRASLLTVMPNDFVRTAIAKGLGRAAVMKRHVLRNALLPTITLVGLALPAFATGAVFVEKVFSWPGMGYVTVSAVAARDYPLVTSGVLVMSILVVLGALIADIAVVIADPRVRLT